MTADPFAGRGEGSNGMIVNRPEGKRFVLFLGGMALLVASVIGLVTALFNGSFQDAASEESRAALYEPIALMAAAKPMLVGAYYRQGSWPVLGRDVIITTSGKYTASIVAEAGRADNYAMTATLKRDIPQLAGKTVRMWTEDGGDHWQCGAEGVDPKYFPKRCRMAVR